MGKTKDKKVKPPGDEEQKRMTSIARQIHFRMIGKRICLFLSMDILMLAAAVFVFLAGMERTRFTKFVRTYDRSVIREYGRIWYCVENEAGQRIMHADISFFVRIAVTAAAALFIFELFMILLGYVREDRKIRKILNPINEIALRADELSRFAFTEDKYQLLEDAIENIDPAGTDAEKLSFGDADLVGIEAAMNNLLLRMRETYRQQARFVNDASHELRTPIAVIQGYANMLRRWGREDEKILDESITAISNESEHMNHLVEQLLFLARGDSGKTVLKKEQIDLAEMVREIYEESFMIDENHPYRFRFDGKMNPPEDECRGKIFVSADTALLKQAVRILVDNAAKYTRTGDEIFIGCGKEGGSVYIEVQDTGIGMAEADAAHMFERFYRSDEVRSYQGTGLGLSIAKWIVDKHGGHFEVLSRTGLGTRIRIIL